MLFAQEIIQTRTIWLYRWREDSQDCGFCCLWCKYNLCKHPEQTEQFATPGIEAWGWVGHLEMLYFSQNKQENTSSLKLLLTPQVQNVGLYLLWLPYNWWPQGRSQCLADWELESLDRATSRPGVSNHCPFPALPPKDFGAYFLCQSLPGGSPTQAFLSSSK